MVTVAGPCEAQSYPTKPIQFFVPFAPGGGADLVARVVAAKMAEGMGVPVVVENRPGAGGTVAATIVKNAPPDGYTIYEYNIGNAIAASVYKRLEYDPINDFTPVTLLTRGPFLMIANTSTNLQSIADLVAYAKANPGKVSFASSGFGGSTHLAGELLKSMAGFNMIHVPYGGAGPAVSDLMGGRVQVMFVDLGMGLQLVESGKVRALGVTSLHRSPLAPNIPTVAETVPNYEASAWFAIALPARAPRPVVDKLSDEAKRVLALPDVREKLSAYELAGSTPEEAARFIKDEVERWGTLVKTSGISIDN